MSGVRLDRAVPGDAEALLAALAESRDYHVPFGDMFTDRAGFDAWIDRAATGINMPMVARADDGGIVGVVTVSNVVMGALRGAFLGYVGMVGFARRGLMTQAVRLGCRFAFDDLGLHRLEANIQPDNAASIALAKRVGFRLEGFSPRYLRIRGAWCDHERYALLAEEFSRGAP